MYGVLAPHGTPPEVVRKLHDDIVRAVQLPEVKKALESASIDIIANTPEEFARYIESETAKWAQVVRASGAKVE
jgi:tripartite-type tricarboxylate transporter receptor subunit TctC